MRKDRLLWLGVGLIVVGGLLGWFTQTAGGIRIQDIRFSGANGALISGLLYIPANATATTPAPGILAVHGYFNSRETQSAFAIEFARRGYVVLALDQPGSARSANTRGRKRTAANAAMVPRGEIEFPSIPLKKRDFSSDGSPVYLSVYPAFNVVCCWKSGLAVRVSTIMYHVGQSDGRRAFTIGHEFGHYVLHRQLIEEDLLR